MFTFKYKKNEKKIPNFLIIVIMLLMAMQIIVTNKTIFQSRVDEMTDRFFRISNKILADDENRYKSIVNLVATIYSDSDILTAFKRDDLSDSDSLRVCAKMRKYASVAGDIDNVYYYESEKNVFYDMMSRKYDGNDERFECIITEINKDKAERRNFLTANELGIFFGKSFCYYFVPDSAEKDAIIVLASEMAVKTSFDEIQKMLANEMYVALDDGTILYGGGKYRYLENISNRDFFAERKNNEIYIDKKADNTVFCYLNEKKMNKWYIVAIPMKNIKRNILNINYIYLYSGILISVISLVYILIFRLRLKHIIGEYAGKTNARKEADKKSAVLRKKILDYIYEPQEEKLEKLTGYLSPEISSDRFFAFVFADINRYEAFERENRPSDTELYKYGIRNIITELISQCGADVFDMAGQKDRIEFLLAIPDKESFAEAVHGKLSECRTEIGKYIGVDMSFFVSDCFEIGDIDKAHFQMENIRSYKYIYGNGCILYSDCIREEDNARLLETRQKCKEFCRELYKESETKVKENLNGLFEEICTMNSMQAQEIIWFLVININMKSNSLNIQSLMNNSEGNMIGAIKETGTAAEIKEEIEKNISSVYTALDYNSKHRFDTVVEKCDEIIEAEYKDSELSINSIAERLSLSVNYLGRNYKKQAGRSISETITDRRLSEVAKLLATTDKDVKDIVAECGLMTNSSYLASIFKKRYGMTPIDYRNSSRDGKTKN